MGPIGPERPASSTLPLSKQHRSRASECQAQDFAGFRPSGQAVLSAASSASGSSGTLVRLADHLPDLAAGGEGHRSFSRGVLGECSCLLRVDSSGSASQDSPVPKRRSIAQALQIKCPHPRGARVWRLRLADVFAAELGYLRLGEMKMLRVSDLLLPAALI